MNEKAGDQLLCKVDEFEQTFALVPEDETLTSEFKSWLRRKTSKITCQRLLLRNFPIITSLRGYQPLRDLPSDVISGLTVGVMHIPQGMAFAALANLPPIIGLYVAFVSCLVYFFIGGSRQASMGVIAVVCLMISSILDRELLSDVTNARDVVSNVTQNVTLASQEMSASATPTTLDEAELNAKKIQLATAVTFASGLFLAGLGLLGFGFVTTFMPDALIMGFTTGAATHVAVSQMSSVLGLRVPRHSGAFKLILTVLDLCKSLPETNWVPLVISLVSMVIMYIVRVHVNQRYSKTLKIPIPIELIVMILSIVMAKYCHLHDGYNLKIVGDIPTGVPRPEVPNLRLARNCVGDALAIAVVAFTQSVALAKTFALKNGYRVDPNQEMFAYGVCTLVSASFSGIVAAASMARSLVQDSTGGKTQIASLIGTVIVLLVILFLGPLFYYLPACILSSVILVNLRSMFRQLLLVRSYWRQSKVDMVLFLTSLLATLVLDVDLGLGVGVGAALLSVVVRTQAANFHELGKVSDVNIYKPVNSYAKTLVSSRHRVLRFESPLYFANTEMFQRRLHKVLGLDLQRLKKERMAKGQDVSMESLPPAAAPNMPDDLTTGDESVPSSVILDLSGTTFIDTMGASVLKQVIRDLELVDINLYVVGLPEACYHVLRTTDTWEKCGHHFYLSIQHAVADLEATTFTAHL